MGKVVGVNTALIKQAVLAKMANLRQSTSHTKTRGEVSGGGKKPWRQKGTGRARAGSSRSPIWVGGGITFGPRSTQNFKQNLSKKMAHKAKEELYKLLKQESRVLSAVKLHLDEPKTKLAVKLLKELAVSGKKCLLLTQKLEPELILATANLKGIDVQVFETVSLLDLASYQLIVLEKPCFDQVYGKSAVARPVKTKTSQEQL